jgi:stage II sporulation protein D
MKAEGGRMKVRSRKLNNSLFILPPSSLILALLCLAVSCSCSFTGRDSVGPTAPVASAKANVNEDEVDAALEQAAKAALGDREGTIVVMDARSGRLRAVINPRVAFEQAFPPGSAIKPFTALAALRAGLLDAETEKLCPAHYEREGFHISCTHPRSKAPLDLAHALGHSCNYYFSTIGERLSAGAFDTALASFGFGERTGVNALNESPGTLRRAELRPGDVIGESERLLVTPVQLANAYAALVNGGHRYRPQRVAANNFHAQQLARINITTAQRSLLINGMRGAIHYGTASSAHLDLLPLQIYGKTGTSSSSNGFRTQGWFVGIADDAVQGSASRPESVRLIVLVFLRRAHGAEGAEIARPVFEEYLRASRVTRQEDESIIAGRNEASVEEKDGRDAVEGEREASDTDHATRSFRVKVTTRAEGAADVTSTMRSVTLEEYVAGVLAAESSTENEPEALKAHALVIRTFALRNRGRHAQEGFDFCSTTHCERYSFVGAGGDRRAPSNSAAIERALVETRGEVLQDDRRQLVDAYFSVACGGMSANIQSLWGTAAAPQYLRGVRDDFCATMPHHHWTDTIAAAQLLKALRSDPQTDVGARLNDIVITRRDATGRAELLTLEGERRRTVRGWDFKLIVGRALGWNLLKSSRFVVARSGTNFVFRGGGFGHGLGLCQEGAHVMAERGSNYRQIVAKYFPGTSVANQNATQPQRASATLSDLSSSPLMQQVSYLVPVAVNTQTINLSQRGRLSLSSDHFRVSYDARTNRREVDAVLDILEAARADIERRLTVARLTLSGAGMLNVVIAETTAEFIAVTGQPGWAAAASRGSRMELQPLALLRRRGVLQTTLRHEYAHFVIELLGRGRTPRWLAEGLAVHLAGEGPLLLRFTPKVKWTREELERKLARPASAEEMRALYAASYNEVRALIRTDGETNIWRRVAQSSG